jgi:hypothetical protein
MAEEPERRSSAELEISLRADIARIADRRPLAGF